MIIQIFTIYQTVVWTTIMLDCCHLNRFNLLNVSCKGTLTHTFTNWPNINDMTHGHIGGFTVWVIFISFWYRKMKSKTITAYFSYQISLKQFNYLRLCHLPKIQIKLSQTFLNNIIILSVLVRLLLYAWTMQQQYNII